MGLTVYADESGTHDKRGILPGAEVTALAGYITTKRSWDIFSQRWKTALRQYKAPEIFHMSELWREEPPYDKWSDAKRKNFLVTLIRIARDNTWCAFGGMVSNKDWNEVLPDRVKGVVVGGRLDFSHPYHFCFQMFFVRFMEYLTTDIDRRFPRNPGFKEKVTFVFDQQKQFGPVASEGFHIIKELLDPEDRFTSLTFASKKDYVPLQAADLLAFYARRILTHDMQNKAWHDPFEKLLRHNLMLHYFTRQQLIDFAKSHPSAKL